MMKYVIMCAMFLAQVVSAEVIYSNITNQLKTFTDNKNWSAYYALIIDNKAMCISNGFSLVEIAVACLNTGDAAGAYTYSMSHTVYTSKQNKMKKYDVAMSAADRLKDSSKIFEVTSELLIDFNSSQHGTQGVDEYAFTLYNRALSMLLTLNPKQYDIKSTLYIANAKFSLMLLEDRTKWEVFIAKIRLSLEVL